MVLVEGDELRPDLFWPLEGGSGSAALLTTRHLSSFKYHVAHTLENFINKLCLCVDPGMVALTCNPSIWELR